VLVKPTTVVQRLGQGFRLFWRWRSRSGPSMDREVADLIRRMNIANPLWGPPRIHGELLKLGININQAGLPSIWREGVGGLRRPGVASSAGRLQALLLSTCLSLRPRRTGSCM
jgi:hypothetical protein